MGVWGYRPIDNDTASDWMISVKEQLDFIVMCGLSSKYWEERLMACQLLVDSNCIQGVYFRPPLYNEAFEVMDALQADKEWINSFRNPDTIRQTLKHLRQQLRELCNDAVKMHNKIRPGKVSRRRPKQ